MHIMRKPHCLDNVKVVSPWRLSFSQKPLQVFLYQVHYSSYSGSLVSPGSFGWRQCGRTPDGPMVAPVVLLHVTTTKANVANDDSSGRVSK